MEIYLQQVSQLQQVLLVTESQLTGVASTENIRTNTNATFLQNVNVSGSTTTGSAKVGVDTGVYGEKLSCNWKC